VTSRLLQSETAPIALLHRGHTVVFEHRPARRPLVKRAVDLAIVVPLAVLALPVLVLAAIGVCLTSRGPILFTQLRASSRTRSDPISGASVVEVYPFRCLKFRTMRVDADEAVHVQHVRAYVRGEVGATDGSGFKVRDDDRVTRLGWFLRRTSIDELPQLINILRGDMSLVGPRPVPLYEVDEYPSVALERLLVKPGLTGLWQVEARSRATFAEMVEFDILYARSNSIRSDLLLLARTIPRVLGRRGAA
jgi:lipopolysaccharide/colanic/teichoic acid biosynthesis glycosyltransferase